MNDTTGIVGYQRVSTQSQVDHGDGLEIQRRKIEEYCKEKGWKIDRFYEDRGISGRIPDRPALLDLLKDCESGKVKRVVVYKQDRLSRELTVALWIETQFKKYDVELNSVFDPDYDMEDPLQKAFKRIADIFAELEKDVIASRLKEGRINNAKNGKRGSGPIPFGYVKVGDTLQVNAGEAEYVRKMFRWYLDGHGYSSIAKILNQRGVLTKRGKLFQVKSVTGVLRNNFYTGNMTFGSISSKGAHEAIISRKLFVNAQRRAGILSAN